MSENTSPTETGPQTIATQINTTPATSPNIKLFLLGAVVMFLFSTVSFIGGIYVGKQMPEDTTSALPPVQQVTVEVPEGVAGPGRGYSFGPTDSNNQVQIWADMQCPYCAALDIPANKIFKDAVDQGKAHIEYFYSAFVNEHSQKVNNALACAYDQGKFYEFKNKAYQNQEQAKDTNTLITWGEELGIEDTAKYKECVTTLKYGAYVNSVTDVMHAAGINKTPTVVFNGESILENQNLTYADLITKFGLNINDYNDIQLAPSASPTEGE